MAEAQSHAEEPAEQHIELPLGHVAVRNRARRLIGHEAAAVNVRARRDNEPNCVRRRGAKVVIVIDVRVRVAVRRHVPAAELWERERRPAGM